MNKDLLSLKDLSATDLAELLDLSLLIKKNYKNNIGTKVLTDKSFALIFEKPSTRTYVSFDIAINQLGGHCVTLPPTSLGGRESLHDFAKTLSRYVQGIIIRTFSHKTVQELALHSTIPVINALSDKYHPCQILADYQTIIEHKGHHKLKVAFLGDGYNIANSLMELCAIVGFDLHISTPQGYEPEESIVKEMSALAKTNGGAISITNNPEIAIKQADIVYTDTWTSMGHEKEADIRSNVFKTHQVNSKLLALAKDNFLVMHCLPAHRGKEITDEVMDSKQSIVFDQAENRLHMQKAVLCKLYS